MGLPPRYDPEISPTEIAKTQGPNPHLKFRRPDDMTSEEIREEAEWRAYQTLRSVEAEQEVSEELPIPLGGKFDWSNPPKNVGYITFPTRADSFAGFKIPVEPLTVEELEEKARREAPLDSPPEAEHEDTNTIPQNSRGYITFPAREDSYASLKVPVKPLNTEELGERARREAPLDSPPEVEEEEIFTIPQSSKFGGGISEDTPFNFEPVPREKMETIEIEMDDLITQLDRAKLQTAAVQSSRTIQVPRGFKMDLQMTPKQFYETYARGKRVEKRSRDKGIFTKGHYKQRHGFRPEELLWNGALEKGNCLGSSLDNEIHPFFDRNNFDDCPDQIYDALIPAFRLASIFLTQAAVMHYWVACFYGVRSKDDNYGLLGWRIRDRPATDLRRAKAASDRLRELANRKLVHFTFAEELHTEAQRPVRELFPRPVAPKGHRAYAVTQGVCNCAFETIRTSGLLSSTFHVTIHRDFYIAAEKTRLMKYPDPAQNLRLYFNLAVTLCHELAHAVENTRHSTDYMASEVYHLNNTDNEAGCTWESYVFGGRINAINSRADGAHGIAIWDWPETVVSENHASPGVRDSDIKSSISMGYIEALQQMKTWQQDYDLWDWKIFHVPRDGATALYLNQFTTMDWTEEKRVREEEYLELLQAEEEQRAKKKRQTGTGRAVVTKAGGDAVDISVVRGHEPTNLGIRPGQLGSGHHRSRPLSRREERWRVRAQKKKVEEQVQKSRAGQEGA